MGLKYASELPRCPHACDCLARHEQRRLIVYRLLHRQATEADFIPPAKAPGTVAHGAPRCSNLALSFFNTQNKALRQVDDLIGRGVDVAARYGDHIGKIELLTTDGLLSKKPSSSGHLNLFQEEGATFAHRVTDYAPAFSETSRGAGDAA